MKNLFSALKGVNELPQHWSLKSKIRYAIEHKIESGFLRKPVNSVPKRQEEVLENKRRTSYN